MAGWVGLAVIVLVVVVALAGLSSPGEEPGPLTPEEYEQRVAEAKGLARGVAVSGLAGLDESVNPQAARAIEARRDLKAGCHNDGEKKGEGDEPGAKQKRAGPTEQEENDA